MPEQPPKSVEKLADHIQELESLIEAKKGPGASPGMQVPILDDVVEPDAGARPTAAPEFDAAAIESRLLRRLDAELAELTTVIRDVVRRCIREELAPGARETPSIPEKPRSDG
jgi:hypothetical protein